ncbi:transcriptional regulator [Clostridiales bacterium PH28_bin88]|nr:transcriptional regulator [Clostridiales bacterium PH28_bin88]
MFYQQLVIFKTVAETRNITLAAKRLHISQPSISLQVQNLENYFGARLFERTRKGVYLTEAGQFLYKNVLKVFDLLEDTRHGMSRFACEQNSISIAATFTIGEYLIPRIVGYLYQVKPEIEVKLKIANTKVTYQDVLEKNVDLGLIEGPTLAHKEMVAEKFWEDELVVVIPYHHLWAKKTSISVEDLRIEKIILREQGSGTRKIVELALKERGLSLDELNITMELGSTQAIKEVVAAGLGITIISNLTVKKDEDLKILKTLQIKEGPIRRPLSVLYNSTSNPNPHVNYFMNLLNDHDKMIAILEADYENPLPPFRSKLS